MSDASLLEEAPSAEEQHEAALAAEADDRFLYLDGITLSFDGFRALNELSLVIAKGELRTIIGPNGAGKTTMMDVMTGKTRPDKGEAEIANLGIGRKFQKPTVFQNLSVFENLELALRNDRRTLQVLFSRLSGRQYDRIEEVLRTIGLLGREMELAGRLSHGQKQWLEIGMLLIQDAQILLLDEPVAGMTDAETEATSELFLSLAGQRTVIVVEHDMAFVRSLGGKVTVLHEGSVLAEGSIDAVQSNERVIEVYLGR